MLLKSQIKNFICLGLNISSWILTQIKKNMVRDNSTQLLTRVCAYVEKDFSMTIAEKFN